MSDSQITSFIDPKAMAQLDAALLKLKEIKGSIGETNAIAIIDALIPEDEIELKASFRRIKQFIGRQRHN